MIRLVGGLPGSGKSFYAANFISKFGDFDKLYQTFVIKKDIKIFTNLDDLQIQHENLETCIQRYGGAEKFFTIENFAKVREHWPKAHILVIIDEAQRLIDDELLKNKDVAFFFQYHRHLGIDIFLLTNDIASCSKKVVQLCEFVIEAQPRSKSLPGVFRYKFKDTKGTQLYTQSIKAKPEVFSIYKSFTTDETEKPKNVIMHWCVALFIVLCLSAVGFKVFVNGFLHKKAHAIGRDGKPVELPVQKSPVQKSYSTARTPVKVSAVVAPAPVVAHASTRKSARSGHRPSLPPVPPASPSDNPVMVPRSVTVPAVVAPPPDSHEWLKVAVTGVITINKGKWFCVAGSDPIPAADCKDYDSLNHSALCRQTAAL